MKKTFKIILAGVFALLAVSCYDDSDLKRQNDLLKEELENLKKPQVDVSEFGINRKELFLMYSAERSLRLIAEGVKEYSVMNEPDGWQATIEGTTLKIKAPTKEAYELGAAALKGEITIHATSETGACKTAKLAVESGAGLRLSLEGDNLVIRNAYTASIDGNIEFASFAIGMMEIEEWIDFESTKGVSFEEHWKRTGMPVGQHVMDFYQHAALSEQAINKGAYVEGMNEVDVITVPVDYLWGLMSYAPIEHGVWTIWASGLDTKGQPRGGIGSVTSVNTKHEVNIVSIGHDDVQITVNVAGADNYLVGCVSEYGYAGMAMPNFYAYMNELWPVFQAGGYVQLGKMYRSNELNSETAYSFNSLVGKLLPGTKYYYWIMPVYDYRSVDVSGITTYPDYSLNTDFYPYAEEFTTADLQTGGPDTQIEAGPSMMDAVSALITLKEGQSAYYAFFSATEYEKFTSEEAIIKAIDDKIKDDITADMPFPVLTSTGVVAKSGLAGKSEKYYCAAYTTSPDGKRGEFEVLSGLAVGSGVDEEIEITLDSLTEEGDNYVAEFTVSGATDVYWYNTTASEDNTNKFDRDMANLGFNITYYFTPAPVQNDKLKLTFAKNTDDSQEDLYVYAYNRTTSLNLINIFTGNPRTLVTSFNRAIVNIETELAKNAQ